MISSVEAGVDLHVLSWHVVDRKGSPNILHVKVNFLSNDWYASIPSVRMLARYDDWKLNYWEIDGISQLKLLDVQDAKSDVKDPDYRVSKTYKFKFEMLSKKEIANRAKQHSKSTPSFLRKFNNLVIDEECE
jgi:hypothetical protein